MVEKYLKTEYISCFQKLQIGEIMFIPVSCLKPTQSDDGRRIPNTELMWDPISACCDGGNILIIHGHHRYFTLLKESPEFEAEVIKVRNPYLDY